MDESLFVLNPQFEAVEIGAQRVTATGSSMPRTQGDRAQGPTKVDVTNFGATGNGTTDDGPAINLAIAAANTIAASGAKASLLFPVGIFRVATALTPLVRNVSVLGQHRRQSYIFVDPSYVGDLFQWSECFNTVTFTDPTADKAGPRIANITLIADRDTAVGQQNALVFYDRNDQIEIENVLIRRFNGHAFRCGQVRDTALGFIREAFLQNIFISSCGAAGIAAFEIGTEGSGDVSNQIYAYNLNIVGSVGRGLHVRNANTLKRISVLRFFGLRIEGEAGEDGLVFGDETLEGGVSDVEIYGCKLTGPGAGFSAFKTLAPNVTAGARIFQINVHDGNIGPTTGKGIDIQAGRNMRFHLNGVTTTDTNITVGPASQGISGRILFDGNGQESGWTYDIDPTSVDFVHAPLYARGDPSGNTELRVPTFADGAGAQAGTLSNAPAAGNPTAWIPIDDNGTTRYVPVW